MSKKKEKSKQYYWVVVKDNDTEILSAPILNYEINRYNLPYYTKIGIEFYIPLKFSKLINPKRKCLDLTIYDSSNRNNVIYHFPAVKLEFWHISESDNDAKYEFEKIEDYY